MYSNTHSPYKSFQNEFQDGAETTPPRELLVSWVLLTRFKLLEGASGSVLIATRAALQCVFISGSIVSF